MNTSRSTWAAVLALACAVAAGPAGAAPVDDNFESYAVGSFPSPTWSDFAGFFPDLPAYPPAVLPSMRVVATTDAFGNPTQALQNIDGVGLSKGVYAAQAVSLHLSVSADVRTLQFANSDPATVLPWQDYSAGVGMWTANPDAAPFVQIYASSTTHGWRLAYSGAAAVGPDLDDYDLGAAAQPGLWYHVQLDFDRQAGSLHSMITDIATNTVLVDSVIVLGNWQPGNDPFDSLLLGSGEVSGTLAPWPGGATIANIAQTDNVNFTSAVPEPAPSLLMLGGLLVLAGRRAVRRGT